ncbi:MAG: carbamoyl-phosphate synthase domain-containing protein, partial [Verrucomicrobiota bacterium]
MNRAILALADGRVFEGMGFGAEKTSTGEACFNTSMTGYQEVLTDPSYRGQIVTMTYPLIGNYGVNPSDAESKQPHVRGFVVEELCEVPSNWRSEEGLDAYLKKWDIPGIQGIDTRALTKYLRTTGAMQAVLTSDPSVTPEQAVQLAKDAPSMAGSDFVKEVSTKENYKWDEDDSESREWALT